MKTALKTLALAAALLAPAPVLAQAAAGSVPNSFDAPAAQATPAPQRPGQAPVQAPAAAAPADVAEAEAALRGVIVAIQGPGPDYSAFTQNLAAQIRQQADQVTPLIKSFGALRTIEHVRPEGQAQLFRVTFDNQATEWIIGFGDDGKIAALLFRPAEA
ncbi:MAG: hypothetical protein DI552_06735 [Brevundimonas sp.]|uniref:DUF3887 domain-containing protein n=1 Tax=Brevundimonas albigilva TaxID=1312364 RepID=A0ABY4SNN5_9CAUL|nr:MULTISPECIES: hypothetical protein [Brevundimonas]MCV0415558.1 hypothetical protein [Brevundimonas sp.]PZU58645.1 MAG: hypothetical protein DI552_06735 [Brevundimonas sp.]URI15456.1 hypothetical protein M8231_00200 [Brevundimonas albigilva]